MIDELTILRDYGARSGDRDAPSRLLYTHEGHLLNEQRKFPKPAGQSHSVLHASHVDGI